ncbi:MAG: O-antigen ligase family protein [Planctomycetes bacterium]|nr:O-antigen ligase family protein [Planctomycetota bacterium]
MAIIRIRDPNAIGPLAVVLIVLVAFTVAGGSWFLSAAESKVLVDGAVEWQAESPLRAVVHLLCLGYQFPTIHAGAVKGYLFGIGAGLAVIAWSIATVAGARRGDSLIGDEASAPSFTAPAGSGDAADRRKLSVAPLLAAQASMGLYLLWSFASSRWSAAPPLAVGASLLLATQLLWAFTLGNGLNPPAAKVASRLIVVISSVTALLAIWYYYGRNPTLRAKFPFGNPLFLAACLIPGIILAFTCLCEEVGRVARSRNPRCVPAIVAVLGVIALALWAFRLTDARGPTIGLVVGLLAVAFFALRGPWRVAPVLITAALLAAAWFHFSAVQDRASPTGRSASIRLRLFAWDYAWQMFTEDPLTGAGQGGFAMRGDSLAGDDILRDPEVFRAPIAHAHNEWLEVMADLGSVGIVLVVMALVLTFRAGLARLRSDIEPGERWTLIGLMAGIVGLVVEETFGVGLRVSGVPVLFYTLLGLTWAVSAEGLGVGRHLSSTFARRAFTGVAGALVGLALFIASQQDFAAARSAYQAEEKLRAGEFEDAIYHARAATAKARLNPQRALEDLRRLSEAYTLLAKELQERALDREERGRESDLPDQKLLALAAEDRQRSDETCVEAALTLKNLVEWSPGYLNHGRVECWLNLVQAANAAARGDEGSQDLALRNAAAAIERELLRQPFNPVVALEFARIAGDKVDLKRIIEVIARPLRYNQVTAAYAEVLGPLTAEASFEERFAPIVLAAAEDARVLARVTTTALDPASEIRPGWGPETLRLAAIIDFRRGNYHRAREVLQVAREAYDTLAEEAPLAAASCYMELGDCGFFSDPADPQFALANAQRAIELAPPSAQGRQLVDTAKDRMIQYWLAFDDEEQARQLLRETAQATVSDEQILHELGVRYLELCESLLGRRLAYLLRQSPTELLPKLQRWLERAMTLNPDEPLAYFYAADLAFHQGDCPATADHLNGALERNLSLEAALQFLEVAIEKRPDCVNLKSLRDDLSRRDAPQQRESASPTAGGGHPPGG